MTTTIKVSAHCADDVEVEVVVSGDGNSDAGTHTLLNGEQGKYYVYDDQTVTVKEQPIDIEKYCAKIQSDAEEKVAGVKAADKAAKQKVIDDEKDAAEANDGETETIGSDDVGTVEANDLAA